MNDLNQLPLRSIAARADFEMPAGRLADTWPYHLAVTRAALTGLEFGQLTVLMGENGAGEVFPGGVRCRSLRSAGRWRGCPGCEAYL